MECYHWTPDHQTASPIMVCLSSRMVCDNNSFFHTGRSPPDPGQRLLLSVAPRRPVVPWRYLSYISGYGSVDCVYVKSENVIYRLTVNVMDTQIYQLSLISFNIVGFQNCCTLIFTKLIGIQLTYGVRNARPLTLN